MTLLLLKRASAGSFASNRIFNASLSRSLSIPSLISRTSTASKGSLWRQRQDSTSPILHRLTTRPSPSARWFSLTKWRQSSPRPENNAPEIPQGRPKRVLPSALTTPHENIYTLPNMLTVSRLILAPFIGYCIVHGYHSWAFGLFAYAGISDLLDGWIARKWNLGTVVGTIIDPLADKTLMTVLTVSLAMQGALPVWLAVIILGRDIGLGIAAIYYRWISLPPPKTFSRYWDFSLPSAEVRPTTISKYNTALQLGLMGLTITAPIVPLEMGMGLVAMQYIVATTTVWSGASYVYSKDAVKILSAAKDAKKEGGDEKDTKL